MIMTSYVGKTLRRGIQYIPRVIHARNSSTGSTIYALSSGHGKCGVAVIRVSGPTSLYVMKKLTKFTGLPTPRYTYLKDIVHPSDGKQIDKGLAIWFPGPASFTGEDSCELQVHGGSAVIRAIFDALGSFPELRPAEAGDFTKRAFANGKLDLTEVEGLADLIHAETEAQRRQAIRQMEGGLSHLYSGWREKLIKSTAHVEAYIDFSEEDMIEDGIIDKVADVVQSVEQAIDDHLHDNRRGERLRSGVHVVIIGEPNVGKSSLMNAISQRPAAIVSPIPGTTRDVVETALDIGGYPVLLSDTAGLRETQEMVEKEGVKRALNRAQNADLKVVVVDASLVQRFLKPHHDASFLHSFIEQHLLELGIGKPSPTLDSNESPASELRLSGTAVGYSNHLRVSEVTDAEHGVGLDNTFVVVNKSDLLHASDEVKRLTKDVPHWCVISCITDDGMENFLNILTSKVKQLCESPSGSTSPSLTQARHRAHLQHCREALFSARDQLDNDVVLSAQQLRLALRHIGKITGKITSEEVLDVVFKDFCIGK